ncbi:hypothetical protein [uncultured Amnibacterium sp.]|uniref:hypothetical protein n=1 Tax=uncultured Amnibacterium sp. TaxID=1631851 RepID=UPI0035CB7D2F
MQLHYLAVLAAVVMDALLVALVFALRKGVPEMTAKPNTTWRALVYLALAWAAVLTVITVNAL